ncbi:hypothetical protein KOR42_26720 [Thalassoglobus neptunius]|uniref:Uncharacterized protein n=1 Tax=Thalassoglobus neptunius TaxID=1938619 RepID=A0A5C5X061_9PLAN|nr:hypothetical protein [Thalassoglobus neptunius]TWT55545.1 hypothetical protein KOR42_26720 [Thalassoglobus neptunius]
MDSIYRKHGIVFQYPQGLETMEQQTPDNDLTITVSDGAAFWSITLLWERPDIEHVLNEARSALEEEYGEVESIPVTTNLGDREADGLDLNFVCLELINSVILRAVRTGRFTAFIMAQLTDHEREFYRPMFDEITASLDLDDDGDVIIS